MSAMSGTCRYKRKKRGIRLLLLAVLFAVFSFATSLCIAYADAPEYEDYSDLAGKRVSMLTGAPFEELVRSKEPGIGEVSSCRRLCAT